MCNVIAEVLARFFVDPYETKFGDNEPVHAMFFGRAASRGRNVWWICACFTLGLCFGSESASADDLEFSPSFIISGFAQKPVDVDSPDSSFFTGRFDAFLTIKNIWQGGTANFHLEYVDGDDFVGLGTAGLIWPSNTLAALPRATASDNSTLSFTISQRINETVSVSFGKFDLVDIADKTPIVGGRRKGSFQYLGIAAPPSFVFPPYIFGAQISVATDPVSYNLFVYDSRNAQGSDFWDNLFENGVVFNGSATYKTRVGGAPGYYGLSLAHSTAEGADYSTGRDVPEDPEQFLETTKGKSFASFKFQQFLSFDPHKPDEGWGVFGQIGFGIGNTQQLDHQFMLGVAGTSPIEGRSKDRWGLAWSRFNWSNDLNTYLRNTGGTGLQDEWAVEAFYEAEVFDNFRVGANILYVRPGIPGFDDYKEIGFRVKYFF